MGTQLDRRLNTATFFGFYRIIACTLKLFHTNFSLDFLFPCGYHPRHLTTWSTNAFIRASHARPHPQPS